MQFQRSDQAGSGKEIKMVVAHQLFDKSSSKKLEMSSINC